MGYLSEERETHFYLDPIAGEWKCWTNMYNWRDRLLKRGWKLKNVSYADGEECDWTFVTDRLDAVKLLDLTKPKKTLTEKQRETLSKYWDSFRKTVTDDKSIHEE